MLRIRRDDPVEVIAGKDKGKRGKVLRFFPHLNRAIVEGVNKVSKHRRPTQQEPQARVIQIPAPIHASNLMLICKNCNRPVRAGFKNLADGTKVRICKRCKNIL
ncbi:MAG: 50S ribosomal protein L24 [Candidatus Omnitrophica bacterium]|nr:50S ribosomal protein L24 [Candidatus Omnitrophota bacterium]